MQSSKTIEHQAVITKIDGSILKVEITQISACASCHAKGYCSLADTSIKTIEIEGLRM